MNRYRFDLATPADDADLRQILIATPVPGRIVVSFRREPSFFAASAVDGQFRQVIAARDETGRIVGFGCRSIRDVFVNGELDTVGYLGTLRLLPEHRNLGLVARGFRKFRKLHEDGRAELYLTTIAEDNLQAQRVLVGARAGLPAYHNIGKFHTAVLQPRKCAASHSKEVRRATAGDIPEIVAFLRKQGPARQFFPQYKDEDFHSESGLLKGLPPEDILLAFDGEQLIGTLGLWNQQGFRQSVVEAYSSSMRWARPCFNLWACARGVAKLPMPGHAFRYITAALPVVAPNRIRTFAELLDVALNTLVQQNGPPLLLGLHEADAILEVVRRYRPRWYTTRFHLVCWQDGEARRRALDGRPPYLELGSL